MVTLRSSRKNTGLDRTEVSLGRLGRRGSVGGITVSVANPGAVVYIKGSEFVDGSIRVIVRIGVAHIEERISGVWNDTNFELDSETLRMGHDFFLSAVGESLAIRTGDGTKRFKVLDIEYDDKSSVHPRVPLVGSSVIRTLFQPIDTSEILSTQHTRQISSATASAVASSGYLKIGAVPPSDDIRLEVTRGLIPGGASIFVRNFTADDFSANIETKVSFAGGISLKIGDNALMTVSSNSAFSMKGDGTEFFFGADLQFVTNEDLVMESMILDNNTDIIFDNSLDPIYTNPVFF